MASILQNSWDCQLRHLVLWGQISHTNTTVMFFLQFPSSIQLLFSSKPSLEPCWTPKSFTSGVRRSQKASLFRPRSHDHMTEDYWVFIPPQEQESWLSDMAAIFSVIWVKMVNYIARFGNNFGKKSYISTFVHFLWHIKNLTDTLEHKWIGSLGLLLA